jgi:hypothetical protein
MILFVLAFSFLHIVLPFSGIAVLVGVFHRSVAPTFSALEMANIMVIVWVVQASFPLCKGMFYVEN